MVAEREGFEPSVEILSLRRFSKPLPSATRPPLHVIIQRITPHPQRKPSIGRDIADEEASYLSPCEGHKRGIRIRRSLEDWQMFRDAIAQSLRIR